MEKLMRACKKAGRYVLLRPTSRTRGTHATRCRRSGQVSRRIHARADAIDVAVGTGAWGPGLDVNAKYILTGGYRTRGRLRPAGPGAAAPDEGSSRARAAVPEFRTGPKKPTCWRRPTSALCPCGTLLSLTIPPQQVPKCAVDCTKLRAVPVVRHPKAARECTPERKAAGPASRRRTSENRCALFSPRAKIERQTSTRRIATPGGRFVGRIREQREYGLRRSVQVGLGASARGRPQDDESTGSLRSAGESRAVSTARSRRKRARPASPGLAGPVKIADVLLYPAAQETLREFVRRDGHGPSGCCYSPRRSTARRACRRDDLARCRRSRPRLRSRR